MIIWSGFGILVPVIVIGFSLVLNIVFNSWFGPGYYDNHKWPLAISLFVSAVACWLIGAPLHRADSRTLIDKATGQEVSLRRSHSFFFIPILIWAPLLVIIGIVLLFIELFGLIFSHAPSA